MSSIDKTITVERALTEFIEKYNKTARFKQKNNPHQKFQMELGEVFCLSFA